MEHATAFPNPTTPPATCASSATAIRAAAATACRSWCIAATPMSAISSPRASPSSTCAIPSAPKTVKLRRRAAEHLDAASAGARRSACSSSTTRTCSRSPSSPTRRTITRARSIITPSEAPSARDWSAGMAVYDISKPAEPRQIGFMPVEGTGLHRIWYVGGRWAYASALLDGFTDYIMIMIDMANPEEAGPGRQILAAGHEQGGGRESPTGRRRTAASACITRSFTTTSPIAAGATPASPSSTSRTRPTRN